MLIITGFSGPVIIQSFLLQVSYSAEGEGEGDEGSSRLVAAQAFLRLLRYLQVSDELIRVAILWHELWHEGLEEASRLYFSEGNVKGMLTALEPLHQMMEKGPQTLKETSFNQVRMMNSELNFYSAFTI